MTQPILLSILIPTVVGREEKLKKLLSSLSGNISHDSLEEVMQHKQYELIFMITQDVEVIIICDDKNMTVGEKRNKLYRMANGAYSFMPDDDDSVAGDFINKVLTAIQSSPDCVTYWEHCTIDNNIYKSRHSIEYPSWYGDGSRLLHDGFHYHRNCYFKDVIKTSIAQQVKVPEIRWNEDEQFAIALAPLLHTENHIPEFMYYYDTKSENPIEKYGLDK